MISKICASRIRYRKIQLAYIIDSIEDKLKREGINTQDNPSDDLLFSELSITKSIPTLEHDFREYYLREKHYVLMNIPRPNVNLVGKHSFVFIYQYIAHFLGSNHLPYRIESIEKSQNCMLLITEYFVAQNATRTYCWQTKE